MGAIWTSPRSIAGHFGELVGYKAGLALTREELAEHLRDTPVFREAVLETEDYLLRVRSDEYETAVRGLLYRVGNLPTPHPLPPGLAVFRHFKHDPIHSKVLQEVLTRCVELLNDDISDKRQRLSRDSSQPLESVQTEYAMAMLHTTIGHIQQGTLVDSSRLLETVQNEFGRPGVNIAGALLEALILAQQASPWAHGRWFGWHDTAQLCDLFQSEDLETQYGAFLDQRFIDYLARNSQRIEEINWRKFEGLVGEFFERAGFRVEMGPGRGDGGVDIRVWAPADDAAKPPLVLVQCKRERRKVSQMVVKALWADVSDEGAQSGLIVTTSALAPSAETVRKVRGYPIAAVEREKLRNWIELLRSPGTGTFLA